MRVLVACEFSGVVRRAFARQGHYVVSCDLLPATDGPPPFPAPESVGQHYQGDVLTFAHHIGCFDLMIAHPPCTYLASSGARWFATRRAEQRAAIDFVRQLLAFPIPRIALENPIGVLSTHIRRPEQILQPWQFGHGEVKATCLWLKGLPPLVPTRIVSGRVARVHRESPGPDRWKRRSITYTGLAAAMAEQWGSL